MIANGLLVVTVHSWRDSDSGERSYKDVLPGQFLASLNFPNDNRVNVQLIFVQYVGSVRIRIVTKACCWLLLCCCSFMALKNGLSIYVGSRQIKNRSERVICMGREFFPWGFMAWKWLVVIYIAIFNRLSSTMTIGSSKPAFPKLAMTAYSMLIHTTNSSWHYLKYKRALLLLCESPRGMFSTLFFTGFLALPSKFSWTKRFHRIPLHGIHEPFTPRHLQSK